MDKKRIWIEPWSEDDLELEQRINTPEMKAHLGGPETAEKVVARHHRYVQLAGTGTGRMFRVMAEGAPESVGAVGYWEKQWRDESVYEMGWSIVTPYQGRGYATAAAGAAVDSARAEHKHRYLHAFPSVTNPGSNSVCRRLGFELLGECDFEFPIGNMMRCNDWRLDLRPR